MLVVSSVISFCLLFAVIQSNPLPTKLDLYAQSVLKVRKESLGYPDKNVGKILATWDPDSGVNPEELGTYFQGDILTLPDDKNGLIDTEYRWPGGVIPYQILDGVFNETQLQFIQDAIEGYHANTCIKFVPYDGSQIDYIVIQGEDTGCWSTVGRKGGVQYVNLHPPGCIRRVGTPIHELLHAIGFHHEQTRTDRDDYVEIMWDNIPPEKFHNFEIDNATTAFGVAYDFGSVMHYSNTSFSINDDLPTIETKPPGIPIGQREGFSQSDIDKVNIMYDCPTKK